jgi:eukaryotic-like serine/threonine-protein kinase
VVTKTDDRSEFTGQTSEPSADDIATEPTMVEPVTDGQMTPSRPRGHDRAVTDTLIGNILANRYKVTRRLGAGGFGAVFEAEDTKIKKRVAVKVLTRDLVCDTAVLARFRQEAEAASQAGHENIVDITDFDRTADGHYFLVMEYLEGQDLGALIRSDPRPSIPRVLTIMIQVCRALHAAHSKGIVHRDLKPANIFLTTRGSRADFVKVLDFGISKFMELDGQSARLTKTGQIVGTPLYMSPEQACGEDDVDHRVDIYSMGVIMYEALVGKTPFIATNYLGLIAQHASEPPVPPSKLHPEFEIPATVEEIVLRALAKKPADRFSTMAEMEGALIHALATLDPAIAAGYALDATPASILLARTGTGTPTTAPSLPVLRPSRPPRWIVAVTAAAVVTVGVVVFLAWPRAPRVAPLTFDVRVPVVTRLPDQRATAASAPASQAAQVTLVVTSTPSGASVLDASGKKLGVTPLTLSVARSTTPLALTIKRAGYVTATLSLVPREDRTEELTLRKRTRSALPDEPKGWGER